MKARRMINAIELKNLLLQTSYNETDRDGFSILESIAYEISLKVKDKDPCVVEKDIILELFQYFKEFSSVHFSRLFTFINDSLLLNRQSIENFSSYILENQNKLNVEVKHVIYNFLLVQPGFEKRVSSLILDDILFQKGAPSLYLHLLFQISIEEALKQMWQSKDLTTEDFLSIFNNIIDGTYEVYDKNRNSILENIYYRVPDNEKELLDFLLKENNIVFSVFSSESSSRFINNIQFDFELMF